MTWNPHDPTKPGGYTDWIDHGQRHGNWGQFSGSTLVPPSSTSTTFGGSSSGPTTYGGPTFSFTPTSVAAGGTTFVAAAGEGGGTLVLLVVAAMTVVRFSDEILIALFGLVATAVVCKIASLCIDRKIIALLIAILGVAATLSTDYYYFAFCEVRPASLTESIFSWINAATRPLPISNHMGLVLIALCGLGASFVAFFSAKSIAEALSLPLGALIVTAILISGIALYQTYSNKSPVVAAQSDRSAASQGTQQAFSASAPSSPITTQVLRNLPEANAIQVSTTRRQLPNAGISAPALQTATISGVQNLWLRSGPGVGFTKMRMLPVGTRVTILRSQDKWREVEVLDSDVERHRGFVNVSGLALDRQP